MSINDIIFTIISIFCGVGAIIGTVIGCACAVVMRRQEGEERRP